MRPGREWLTDRVEVAETARKRAFGAAGGDGWSERRWFSRESRILEKRSPRSRNGMPLGKYSAHPSIQGKVAMLNMLKRKWVVLLARDSRMHPHSATAAAAGPDADSDNRCEWKSRLWERQSRELSDGDADHHEQRELTADGRWNDRDQWARHCPHRQLDERNDCGGRVATGDAGIQADSGTEL